MKTKEEFESLVADLTELEMSDLLDSCVAIMEANRWNQLKKTFVDKEEVEDLQYEISKLEEKVSDLESTENEFSDAKELINDAVFKLHQTTSGKLVEITPKEVIQNITDVINTLNKI